MQQRRACRKISKLNSRIWNCLWLCSGECYCCVVFLLSLLGPCILAKYLPGNATVSRTRIVDRQRSEKCTIGMKQ